MSGPTVTTTSPVNRRKRQATLPGDITTPIIETAVSGNGITTPKTGEISTPVIDTTAGGITPDTTPGGITPDSTPGGITPDSTPGGVTATNEIENPMAEVVCNNDTTLIGADGKPYEYNEQDPQWEVLCDNTTVMVVSKMVYSENDIGNLQPTCAKISNPVFFVHLCVTPRLASLDSEFNIKLRLNLILMKL